MLLNLLQYCFCLIVCLFVCLFFGEVGAGTGCKTHGNLVPQPGIKPTPSTLEGKVVTTEPPGKSWVSSLD